MLQGDKFEDLEKKHWEDFIDNTHGTFQWVCLFQTGDTE